MQGMPPDGVGQVVRTEGGSFSYVSRSTEDARLLVVLEVTPAEGPTADEVDVPWAEVSLSVRDDADAEVPCACKATVVLAALARNQQPGEDFRPGVQDEVGSLFGRRADMNWWYPRVSVSEGVHIVGTDHGVVSANGAHEIALVCRETLLSLWSKELRWFVGVVVCSRGSRCAAVEVSCGMTRRPIIHSSRERLSEEKDK